MIHDLKIAPEWFKAVQAGVKTFEVRRDDRDFKPNDILILREFDGEKYTGQQEKVEVRFVLRNEYCREGYCIMSISPTTRIMSRTSGLTTLPVCQKCGRGPLLDTYEFCPYCGRSIENGGEQNG